MGLSHSSVAPPYDAFPTRDGQILIGIQNDHGRRTLVTDVLGMPELAEDPWFTTNIERMRHRAECDAYMAEQTSELPPVRCMAGGGYSGRRRCDLAAHLAVVAGATDHGADAALRRWQRCERRRWPYSMPPSP